MLLEERLKVEKKRYLDFIKKHQDKKIYVYGAGKQANALAEFLNKNKIKFNGFCVTSIKNNRLEENGISVVQIDEINLSNNEVAFLVGVRKQLNDEIIEILNHFGYYNILQSTGLIRYLGSYGYNFYTNPMLDITTKIGCSVNCKYCPQHVFVQEFSRNGAEGNLSLDNFKICVDKLPKNTLIEFAGFTEPFLNAACINMIEYAVEKKYKVNIFTTLVGLNDDAFEKMKNIDFEEFVLHVPDEEGYSVIPIDDIYKKRLMELVNKKKKNGKPYIDYACSQGTVPEEILQILGNQVRTYIVLNDRAGNLENLEGKLHEQKNVKGRICCEFAGDINHNELLPDGRVLLCSNDWGMRHVLGNLLEQDYESIINGEEAQRIRQAMCSENGNVLCRNCFHALKEEYFL